MEYSLYSLILYSVCCKWNGNMLKRTDKIMKKKTNWIGWFQRMTSRTARLPLPFRWSRILAIPVLSVRWHLGLLIGLSDDSRKVWIHLIFPFSFFSLFPFSVIKLKGNFVSIAGSIPASTDSLRSALAPFISRDQYGRKGFPSRKKGLSFSLFFRLFFFSLFVVAIT